MIAPGFEPVRDAVDANGGAFAAYARGELVADLGGDALVHVFSVSKPLAAFCVLVLVDRGAIGLDDPAPLPDGATVRHVLAHQAGLLAVREPMTLDELYDWDRAVARLAAEEPWWPPGTAHGEHALFYGHLCGEIVRRADGRSLGRFLAEEVAGPWALDLQLGTRAHHRIAPLTDPGGAWPDALLPDETHRLALDNPPGLVHLDIVGSRAWREAEIPAVNVHATALAVARFFEGVRRGGELDGVRLVRPETAAEMVRGQMTGPDRLLGREATWGLGVALEEGVGWGMGGIGGALGWVDPARAVAYGYLPTEMGGHDRAEAIERALLAVLGG